MSLQTINVPARKVLIFPPCLTDGWKLDAAMVSFNGGPFSYRNRKLHLCEIILLRNGSSNGYQGYINIGSSAPDWPRTVQKHADISTTLKKQVDRYKKGLNTGVLASKYNFGINNLRFETAAVHIATSSKRTSA